MIFRDKGIPDSTVLKVVATLLKRGEATKGFRVKTLHGKRVLTHDEVIQFVEELAQRLDEGSYGAIRRCSTCGNFNRSGKANTRGWCSPKEFTSFRKTNEYCSRWIPMTPEQQYLGEVLDAHAKTLQTK